MWLDELTIIAQGGKGGDGAVHFARRKFEPFAGPDGGDGGAGGDLVLVGKRDLDSLYHLRTANTAGNNGAHGSSNLKIGEDGAPCDVPVPLGTIAYDAHAGYERGIVTASGQRFVAAQGGKGGKGNPHYATGRRRSPKMYETGWDGERHELLLRFRLYAQTALIEPLGMGVETADQDWLLLPRLLKRPAGGIDFDLYRRKPRWARLETDFHKYDVAYLPVLFDSSLGILSGNTEHAYWAQSLVVNLTPLAAVEARDWWTALAAQLAVQPWRGLELCTVLLPPDAGQDWPSQQLAGITVAQTELGAPGQLAEALLPLLRGGVVG